MILNRKETENKIKAMYKSSTILASTYEKDTKALTIIFTNGGQYKYADVTLTDYTRFETADSQGVILNSHIKKYTFEKLAPADNIPAILKAIEDASKTDDKATLESKTKTMLAEMNQLIGSYVQTGKIDNTILRKLENTIVAYEKIANPQPVTA